MSEHFAYSSVDNNDGTILSLLAVLLAFNFGVYVLFLDESPTIFGTLATCDLLELKPLAFTLGL